VAYRGNIFWQASDQMLEIGHVAITSLNRQAYYTILCQAAEEMLENWGTVNELPSANLQT
jgi:hypothetical protein